MLELVEGGGLPVIARYVSCAFLMTDGDGGSPRRLLPVFAGADELTGPLLLVRLLAGAEELVPAKATEGEPCWGKGVGPQRGTG